jgi:hypothetical protein
MKLTIDNSLGCGHDHAMDKDSTKGGNLYEHGPFLKSAGERK